MPLVSVEEYVEDAGSDDVDDSESSRLLRLKKGPTTSASERNTTDLVRGGTDRAKFDGELGEGNPGRRHRRRVDRLTQVAASWV